MQVSRLRQRCRPCACQSVRTRFSNSFFRLRRVNVLETAGREMQDEVDQEEFVTLCPELLYLWQCLTRYRGSLDAKQSDSSNPTEREAIRQHRPKKSRNPFKRNYGELDEIKM